MVKDNDLVVFHGLLVLKLPLFMVCKWFSYMIKDDDLISFDDVFKK